MPEGKTEEKKPKKPFLCKIGIHEYYMNSAFFTQVMCCSWCGYCAYPDLLQRVEYERSLWEEEFGQDLAKAKHNISMKLREFKPTRNATANS